jgi:hypothetical protein
MDVKWRLDDRKSLTITHKEDPDGHYYRQGFFIVI